jgi:tRNA dimethylallyltransferase
VRIDPPLGPDELVVVVGPTASGKTDLALDLAGSLGGEIVNADSVQIYRGFDLGSGKPSAAERARAPHHLFDWRDPLDLVDAVQWAAEAERVVAEARARGRVPIVCGGTFLWVRALVWGLAEMPAADEAIRARHRALAEAEGRAALHAELARVDPASAARLAPNDLVRVSRALEVWETSGRTITEWHAGHGFSRQKHAARFVGVRRTPEELAARIAARTRAFLAAGWIDEVRGLVAEGYGEARAMGSVGYRQVHEHVLGTLPLADLEETVNRATRVFTRRQRTWLREQPVTWVERG